MIPTKHTTHSGSEIWKLPDGAYHREDGPAAMYDNGDIVFWLQDEYYTFKDYCTELKRNYSKTDEDIMMLRMQYDIN